MKHNTLKNAEKYTKAHQKKKRWYQVVTVLACVVVFCTVYALILPAITLENSQCEKQEHIHTQDCYTQVTSVTKQVLVCTEEKLNLHEHTSSCYDEDGNLVCGYADYVVHHHDSTCYDEEGNLWCPLPEIEPHTHDASCYAEAVEGQESSEPEVICGRDEIILHEHTSSCYDGEGNLICGKVQVLEHQHSDACFETVEEPVDTEILTCTLPEDENHTHGPLCYGTWELTCGLEEHTHTAECGVTEEESTVSDTKGEEEGTDQTEEEIPSELPVMGTAYAEAGETQSYGVMLLDDDVADETESSNPLNVEDYVKDATLFYRTEDSQEWKNVQGENDIPGDADFKLEISYANVSIDDLLAANGKMTYTLPELLRNASTQGSITSGTTIVGTITVENDVVTLSFDTSWLEEQKTGTNTVINGDFYVEAEADLSKIEGEQPSEIVVGEVVITIDFDDDIIAQYGTVDLSKTVSTISEEEEGDYLTYTLTVTAGEDGCPDVKVVDQFADASYIEKYVGVTGSATSTNDTDGPQETGGTGEVYIGGAPTEEKPIPDPAGENAENPGTLVWVIGNMRANETRTLTYRVKLKDEYTGVTAKENLQNTAAVYSETYDRDTDTATFIPKAAATMSKVASEYVPNENGDGGGTITYTIWVKADDSNSYTLDNVKVVDALDGSRGNNPTSDAIRQYLSYDENSFHLYQGGVKNQNGSSGLTEIYTGTGLTLTDTDNDGKKNDSFTYYVGPLAPGECKTLTYTVNVEPGVFVEAGNENFNIKNRAQICTDDSRTDEDQPLNACNCTKTLDRKAWSRKLVGDKQEADITVEISENIYDATGDTVTSISSPGNSFTVPAGSYQYQVVANETGDWDLSSASMTDSLSGTYMQFVGYVCVKAYTISDNAPGSDITDADAIKNLNSRQPDQTVWVKVDGKQSFRFTPKEIGLNGTYAYLLTYYAQPVNTDEITQVEVSNRFGLSGGVGIGNGEYTITGIEVSASVTVEGGNSFAAEKQSWYYEEPKVTTGDFKNGALYWVIKVDGSVLPAGTCIKDVTNQAGGSTHYIRDDSLVGVYTGDLGTESFTDYEDLNALRSSNKLTGLLYGEQYSCAEDNNSLTVTLNKDITLDNGTFLYIIVKTEPNVLPGAKRDSYTFNNKLQSSSDGTNWLDHNIASKTLYGSENIFKELGRVFTYSSSDKKMTVIKEGTKQAIETNALGDSGTYVAWQIHVNYEGNLSGRYRVVEQIPEGMEVSYVRLWWLGEKAKAQNPKPQVVQITGDGFNAIDGSWTEYQKTMTSNNAGSQTNYYYMNGQQVIWDVDNLVAGGSRDDYAVEFQIVCRVTDPDVLLGNETKDFNNVVSLQNTEGKPIGQDNDGVTIQKQTLSKTGTYDPETNGGRYPFKITLNELGEDLVSDSDMITLVDELSSTLILDTSTIQVVDSKTGEDVTNWTASVEGQILKMILPDNLPLTVTYETTVNAAPGQTISILNNAHWEGYTTPSGGSVEDNNFSYSTGGTVGVETSPSITVKKLDQYNTSTVLSGAQFSLKEGTYEDGAFTETENGLSLSGTTGEDGTLTFGKESEQTMKYNTVYCLTETKAPDGYVLDSTPHYFVVAKQDDDGDYPPFPENVTVWYQSANYTYQAYNHKGEATVAKEFQDAGGNTLDKIDGTYRFGIYADETPASDPLQTVSIEIKNGGLESKAVFTNLELGKTYYIYELDDESKPIKNDTSATVNGKRFSVTYTGGPAVTISADGTNAATVTVTNRVNYSELPETGGTGTIPYTTGGLLLILCAGILSMYRLKIHNFSESQ